MTGRSKRPLPEGAFLFANLRNEPIAFKEISVEYPGNDMQKRHFGQTMPLLAPLRIAPDSPLIPSVLELVQREFAYMEARINPQSSMHKMTTHDIEKQCVTGEVWVVGERPDACVFFTEKTDCFYLGKLAVASEQRGKGYARQLIRLAEQRARAKGFSTLELETRIELVENHKTFQRLGFKKTKEGAHSGFLEPTYIVMQKAILP